MFAPINVLLFYAMIIICKAIIWLTSAETIVIFDNSNNWDLADFEINNGMIDDLKEYIGKQKVFDDIRLVVFNHVADGGVVPDERFIQY
ncbi:hypothetical protein [Limnofasciculus baicalensis]|uniref:Uncharacterized protein n=1 Tax=Limnofasciculus baicalensis BBK-W-15 TaxID=2699891 RepID=A0AAE3GW78_9CYAN|nr:hypothetical protein [Limnofasciculus baicalensis]MCP2731574.1 hypothetical protein [Limnofasciculus baicalensis BBK-W-15]